MEGLFEEGRRLGTRSVETSPRTGFTSVAAVETRNSKTPRKSPIVKSEPNEPNQSKSKGPNSSQTFAR